MDFPLAPMLMRMQSPKASQQKIQESVGEIMDLLDDFTFNEQEERILQILANFSPEDFMRAIDLLSFEKTVENWRKPVSYLQRLYEDMNGEEFQGLCEMMKSKLLLSKAGSLERMKEVVAKVSIGEATPEIPVKVDFGPSRLAAPSTWERRSFPFDAEFTEDGSLRGEWAEHVGYLDVKGTIRPFEMRMGELLVVNYIHTPWKNDYVSLLDIKNMSDKQHRDFFFTNLNIVGIVFGAGAFAAAKGPAKQALTGLFQVAIPTAGQVITDHEEEILELEHGREFLIAWQAVNIAMAGSGITQLFSPAGKALVDSLTKLKNDLDLANRARDVVKRVVEKISEFLAALKKVKKDVFDQGIEPLSTNSGSGGLAGIVAALKNRKR
ncbi:MAG: hypothetical protein ACREBE_07670, partial [bacterium]